jgi:putative N6-adenine-specific DNA methylase
MTSLYLVTCPKGLVQLLNNELKRLDIKTFDSFDTGTFFQGNIEDCMRVNLRSRIANCVYCCLGEEMIYDFDTLFEWTKKLPWQDFCNDQCHVSIEVNSYVSQLSAARSVQSIVHKAIAESVGCMFPDSGMEREIYVHFKADRCRMFVNTS